MAKISAEQITCRDLYKAYLEANRKAYEGAYKTPKDVSWPSGYGNHVTGKGGVSGESNCVCGKSIEVDLNFNRIESARDINTGKPAKLFNLLVPREVIKVGGTKCPKKS